MNALEYIQSKRFIEASAELRRNPPLDPKSIARAWIDAWLYTSARPYAAGDPELEAQIETRLMKDWGACFKQVDSSLHPLLSRIRASYPCLPPPIVDFIDGAWGLTWNQPARLLMVEFLTPQDEMVEWFHRCRVSGGSDGGEASLSDPCLQCIFEKLEKGE